jgi:bifunctional non-homologous end joining protein LigD
MYSSKTMRLPYRERRQLLERLKLSGPSWSTAPAYEDGLVVFDRVCERGLEGIVGTRQDQPYRPGERRWAKVKNRDYWQYPAELAAAQQGWRFK